MGTYETYHKPLEEHLARVAKWNSRFLDMAELVASWSKDPSTKTGAVIVRPDRTIAAMGYNGFPRKMDDHEAQYDNRETKYSRIIHCEMNAILSARESLDGYTLYCYPFLTCDRCAVHIIQAGIIEVIAPKCPEHLLERWGPAFEKTRGMYREANVTVREL